MCIYLFVFLYVCVLLKMALAKLLTVKDKVGNSSRSTTSEINVAQRLLQASREQEREEREEKERGIAKSQATAAGNIWHPVSACPTARQSRPQCESHNKSFDAIFSTIQK